MGIGRQVLGHLRKGFLFVASVKPRILALKCIKKPFITEGFLIKVFSI